MSADSSKDNLLNRIRITEDLRKALGGGLPIQDQHSQFIDQIVHLQHHQQRFVYNWLEVIRQHHSDLSLRFLQQVSKAINTMDLLGAEEWAIAIMDSYDSKGLGAALDTIEDVDNFIKNYQIQKTAVNFSEVTVFLERFLLGLGGRKLDLQTSDSVYTDTEIIYLPEYNNLYPDKRLNETVYKLQVVYHWAQNRYGTWRLSILPELVSMAEDEQRLGVFGQLESMRLQACLLWELPGLTRAIQSIDLQDKEQVQLQQAWYQNNPNLLQPGATAVTSLESINTNLHLPLPIAKPFHGLLLPHQAQLKTMDRVEKERAQLASVLQQLQQETSQELYQSDIPTPEQSDSTNQFKLQQNESDNNANMGFTLQLNDEEISLSNDMRELFTSILQDHDTLPASYLQVGGQGEYSQEEAGRAGEHIKTGQGGYDIQDAVHYPEWDYARQRYRNGFCTLTEQDVTAGEEEFVQNTLLKYKGFMKSIRRSFEMLTDTYALQRHRTFGNEIDLAALIDATVEHQHGMEMDEHLYCDYQVSRRDITVMFMVDMSGSTRGWVNQAERESLVLLCEALDALNDRYAIYGFSGRTHKRCEIYRIKEFDEAYNHVVKRRISGITPKTYTRMGVAIRHLGKLLSEVPARTHLFITLSDGKPEDYGSYRGRYGIEDTRRALQEISQTGIHPFCITIDKEGGDYLPYMYGVANYTMVDDVKKLPYKVSDIYRRLTT